MASPASGTCGDHASAGHGEGLSTALGSPTDAWPEDRIQRCLQMASRSPDVLTPVFGLAFQPSVSAIQVAPIMYSSILTWLFQR